MFRLHSVSVAVFLLLGGFALPALGQSADDLASHPGYVDLREADAWFDTEATLQVDLRGTLLDLVAQTSSAADTSFSGMVRGLKAIQVRGYPMAGIDADAIRERTDRLAAALEDQGWERVFYARDGAEVARVYLRPNSNDGTDRRIAGLAVLAVDPSDEAVLVNVVGSMHPDQLQKLGDNLNVESLRTIETKQ